MPVAAQLALFFGPIVGTLPLAAFAETLPVLAFPLLLCKFDFESFGIAAVAHVRKHMLLLNGIPIYVLATKDSQQKVWTFQITLSEQSPIERPENQKVFHPAHPGERYITGHGAGACSNLHIHYGCLQRLSLGSVSSP